ncbi:hypothetical protein WME90_46060 [Sorangium sp. So ce375]|uniref:hypothetical protein n=1 Tax=Sorangium sp. So ce375 TaxID=3133306 RepID=UPI003F5C36AF
MLGINHAQTGALEDRSPGGSEARPSARRERERLSGARDAAGPGEGRTRPAPARRCVTARAVRSDMLLVLLAALAALAAGGALGCGHACNYGFSPCPAVSPATTAPGSRGAQGTCPTEYRPMCSNIRCVTDKNGCQICDCVETGAAPLHPRDVQPPDGR